jgi:hypothetical protein
VGCKQMRQDFTVVIMIILAIPHEQVRLEVAHSGYQNGLMTLSSIVYL